VLQEAIDNHYNDELVPVTGPDAVEWSRKLAQQEGILTGISGGGTFAIAMQKAKEADEGAVILFMLPDTGERYLSTPLFDGIPTEMSTPGDTFSCRTLFWARARSCASLSEGSSTEYPHHFGKW
jgi:cysteine synthase A